MPNVAQNDDTVQAALGDVNAFRLAMGLPTLAEVPSGVRGNEHDCPMYHALRNGHDVLVVGEFVAFNSEFAAETAVKIWERDGILEVLDQEDPDGSTMTVDVRGVDPDDVWYVVSAPDSIREFVSRFDGGYLDAEEAFLA